VFHNKTRHIHGGYVFTIALLLGEYHMYVVDPANSSKVIANSPVIKEALGHSAALLAAHKFIDGRAKNAATKKHR
jgi:hypothetical protein